MSPPGTHPAGHPPSAGLATKACKARIKKETRSYRELKDCPRGETQGSLLWEMLPQHTKFQNAKPLRELRPQQEKPSGQGHTGEEGEDSCAWRDGEGVIQVWQGWLAVGTTHVSGGVGWASVWACGDSVGTCEGFSDRVSWKMTV